jgi:hypothetical protein
VFYEAHAGGMGGVRMTDRSTVYRSLSDQANLHDTLVMPSRLRRYSRHRLWHGPSRVAMSVQDQGASVELVCSLVLARCQDSKEVICDILDLLRAYTVPSRSLPAADGLHNGLTINRSRGNVEVD